jgi:hypothetical protein
LCPHLENSVDGDVGALFHQGARQGNSAERRVKGLPSFMIYFLQSVCQFVDA